MPALDGLLLHCNACTIADDASWGLLADAAIGWRDGRIVMVVAHADLPASALSTAAMVHDAAGMLVTPALIDCHTHLVFAGERIGEFEQRLCGASYAQIAAAGGGIRASVAATRAASEDELLAQSLPRARALRDDGVATVEIKSGYGLELEAELRMLRVARRIGAILSIEVRTTLLAAHALPPEFQGRADAYIDAICEQMLPAVAASGLADAVDAFCEGIGFSPAQTARLFARARALGIPVKLHADQLSDLGGAALVAGFGGLSADHLEYTGSAGVQAMARAGTVAVLLPGAFHCLRETQLPPIAELRRHGVPMAVATDCNPGTSPLLSLRLALAMACNSFGLTPLEAVRGATANAAKALGLNDRGRLVPGQRADLALWDVAHPAALAYWMGGPGPRRLYIAGAPVGNA